jgi:hypothetical protein
MLCSLGAAVPTPEYEILYSIQNFPVSAPPGPSICTHSPSGKSPQLLASCNSAAQQPAASTHAARARTLAGRPIALSKIADASTASFAHPLEPSTVRLSSRGLLCHSLLRLLGFSEPDATAADRPSQVSQSQAAASRTQRPVTSA